MRPILAITMGDPAGIGAEITVKALCNPLVYEHSIPVVIGDAAPLEEAISFTGSTGLVIKKILSPTQATGVPGTLFLLDAGYLQPGAWQYKQVHRICGEAAFGYVKKGIALALAGAVHGVVTGPICKEALHLAGHPYAGHTEIFKELCGNPPCAMLLSTPQLKVIHCTTHLPLREACNFVTYERVLETIHLAAAAMKLLGNPHASIAVAGLNAHASENGIFGWEETQWILPAIKQAQSEGLRAEGPIPADTVFVKALAGMYDIVVAMYHDQGHIPVKLCGFKMELNTNRFISMSGVNTTIGLPIIRTSVDHGTAFDCAGEGNANPESMLEAIEMAARMAKNKFSPES